MNLETDVLVVGGGMAGLVAGITALQEGAKSIVVRKGQGATADSSGAIDVAGYLPGGEAPFISPIEGLSAYASLLPFHPYTILGRTEFGETDIELIVDIVREAIDWLKNSLDNSHSSLIGSIDSNIGALSILGTWKPTCLLQKTMHTEHLGNEDEVLLFAGIAGMPSFVPSSTAKSFIDLVMSSGIGTRKVVHTIMEDLSISKQPNLTEIDVARFIETEAGLLETAKSLKNHVQKSGASLVAIPAVMGVENPQKVREYLENEIGAEVFELISFPPSVPGYRLQRSLESLFERAGGKLMMGYQASSFEKEGTIISSIHLKGPRRTIEVETKSVVLCTGKFIGQGLISQRMGIEECLFGLPVFDSDHIPVKDTRPEKMTNVLSIQKEGHTLFGCGIGYDSSLKPIDSNGNVYASNLHAAGSILSGYNYTAEKSGLGVALTTGRVAGKRAAGAQKEVPS
ncbi:MAG: anaerobic glycerol-3-phosphate dehydrogenase subunit GlpB [Candidatus Thorarchaeota archaeon]